MTKDIEREAFEALPLAKLALDNDWVRYHKESNTYYPNEDFCPDSAPETINFAWQSWQAAKAQAVPDGYKVVPVNYECVWCGCTELDGWTDETMIEAQEPVND